MTHPLTPREKVVLKPCPFCGDDSVSVVPFKAQFGGSLQRAQCACGVTGPCSSHFDVAAESWNRRTALASGSGDQLSGNPGILKSGDHAELAKRLRSSKRERRGIYGRVLVNPDGPEAANALEALLAENAALRLDGEIYQNQADHEFLLRKEAERKLAEAVGMLRLFQAYAQSGQHFVYPLGSLQQLDTFLSKEAERG